jgi:hypothetical protein
MNENVDGARIVEVLNRHQVAYVSFRWPKCAEAFSRSRNSVASPVTRHPGNSVDCQRIRLRIDAVSDKIMEIR